MSEPLAKQFVLGCVLSHWPTSRRCIQKHAPKQVFQRLAGYGDLNQVLSEQVLAND